MGQKGCHQRMGEEIAEDNLQDQRRRALRLKTTNANRGHEEDMSGAGDEQDRQILGEMGIDR